ncbi:hypothetical protein KIW84_055925 [Lathyrus oleraceus]|uniref:Uncharacterized protein n=1 Tax=Pisum sativum TaxID=3888 RepID=A0A9D4WWW1_PEA|nr:hypothetical protein KIW84_055925 [Pisum sativum]
MRLLPTKAQRVRFDKFFQKKMLLPPRFGNLDNFYYKCFSFLELFRAQGIDKLLGSYGEVYPDLVRVFYSNLVIEKGVINSNVKGIPITLTKRKKIVGANPERNSRLAGIFTIDDILIHYFLTYFIVPKFANFSTVNDCEMQILYAMKNNIHVNWAYVILNHLAMRNEFACGFRYAHLYTYVLKQNNLNLVGERVLEMVPPDNEITQKKVCNTKTRAKFDPITRTITYINPPQEQAPQE